MIEIDGSRYSGSGTIVRQSVAMAALTGRAVHVVNARTRRPQPGLRRQHVKVVEAICQLAGGTTEGVGVGSTEFTFVPGDGRKGKRFEWDIGSAGSTTLLATALLPVLAFWDAPVDVELQGGLFQDFAPSFYHFKHALLPLLASMDLTVRAEMVRPGYNPRGGGILRMRVSPSDGGMRPVVLDNRQPIGKIWGIALASHLTDAGVAGRMADAAGDAMAEAGHEASIKRRNDDTAPQPGAAFAMFADLQGGSRLGADRAGAPGRRSEGIGKRVAKQLLEDLSTGSTVDRHVADQVIPFAALARGESRFLVPEVTDHIESNAWLVREFLGAEVRTDGNLMTIVGSGFAREGLRTRY